MPRRSRFPPTSNRAPSAEPLEQTAVGGLRRAGDSVAAAVGAAGAMARQALPRRRRNAEAETALDGHDAATGD
ncbi:hypothetical protein HR12_20620 [Microbacterium sp. SUBG005]|nr:hypothetical protein HR12_20620 [Microbacterium sp. SUBG005]